MNPDPGTPATEVKTSVVIVDDHAMYRKGLRAEFATDPTIEVVAEFDNATEAVSEILRLRPAVVLMDLHLPLTPGANQTFCGTQAIARIRERWPEAKIAVLTMFNHDERVREALKAGALSFVTKDGAPEDVIKIVHLTANGTGVLNARASEFVARTLPHSGNGSTSFSQLSPRHNEVLALSAAGYSDRQIAAKLGISMKTVANYWPSIKQNLGVASREEAIELAQEKDFPDEESPSDLGESG